MELITVATWVMLFTSEARITGCLTRSSADADNRLDAFSGQSRSTNIVPFHMLHIVSYCAIVTLSLRRAVFTIFDFKNAVTLKTGLGVRQGHWKCHHVIEHI